MCLMSCKCQISQHNGDVIQELTLSNGWSEEDNEQRTYLSARRYTDVFKLNFELITMRQQTSFGLRV